MRWKDLLGNAAGKDRAELAELLDEATESGLTDAQIAEWLDELVDWRVAIPGAGGQVVETLDGPTWRALLIAGRKAAKRLSEMTEGARAVRRAKRQARRAKIGGGA